MRKLYCLLFLFFSIAATTKAQDIANFTFTIHPGNHVSFHNTSTVTDTAIKKAHWSFGDGTGTTTRALGNAEHHYASPGTYTVCLKIYKYSNSITNPILTAEICKTLVLQNTAADSCRANFESQNTTLPLKKLFIAQPWHNNNKRPEKICWTFGDGTDTCITYNPLQPHNYAVYHQYTQPGNYNVCVKIKYQGGCEASVCKITHVGTPGTVPDSCRADFETDALTTSPLTRKFTAIPWHNLQKKPVKICWDFGDGKDTCIQYPTIANVPYSVTHTYAQPGNYNVCVKILYAGGCEATKCKPAQVGITDSCRADFEIDGIASSLRTKKFTAIPWHNQQKKPVKICWIFGDGSDTCIQYSNTFAGPYTVMHTYAQPGQYNVCVKILYAGGCEASKCKTVSIPPTPSNDTCKVEIHELATSSSLLLRHFIATPSPNRRPEKICWTFGDGRDTCINLPNPVSPQSLTISHLYPAPGVYRVCVKIIYAGGCIATSCKEIVIRPINGICGGYMIDSLTGPKTVSLKGFGIHPANDHVVTYRWTFGDGTAASGQNVTHTYNQPGSYEVCLMIKTNRGCETKICKRIVIAGTNQPSLQLSPNPVINNLHALFISTRNEQVNISIFSVNGLMVRSYVRNATIGANNWDFDVASLPTGIYSVIVSSPNQLANAIFFKQ